MQTHFSDGHRHFGTAHHRWVGFGASIGHRQLIKGRRHLAHGSIEENVILYHMSALMEVFRWKRSNGWSGGRRYEFQVASNAIAFLFDSLVWVENFHAYLWIGEAVNTAHTYAQLHELT